MRTGPLPLRITVEGGRKQGEESSVREATHRSFAVWELSRFVVTMLTSVSTQLAQASNMTSLGPLPPSTIGSIFLGNGRLKGYAQGRASIERAQFH